MINKLLILIILTFALSSCMVVKGYEKVDLNDPDMALKGRKSQKYSGKFHSYREGSAGAEGGKSGGGCGCN